MGHGYMLPEVRVSDSSDGLIRLPQEAALPLRLLPLSCTALARSLRSCPCFIFWRFSKRLTLRLALRPRLGQERSLYGRIISEAAQEVSFVFSRPSMTD